MRVKNEIIRILEKEFSISNLKQLIDDDDSMSFLNISSIQFINLVVELEAFFNIEFDELDMFVSCSFSLFTSICKYIESKII